MSERSELLERLREILGLGGDGTARPAARQPPYDRPPPGCEDVDEIPCEEAAKRLYEYLDGELDGAESDEVRCHVEQCERCYPMYDWERMFLDVLRERGDRPETSERLRERVTRLLDREMG